MLGPRAISIIAFLLVLALCAFVPAFLLRDHPWVARAYVAFGVAGVLYLLFRPIRPKGPPPEA
jgi:hypothetical protein